MKRIVALACLSLLAAASQAGASDCRPVTSVSEAITARHEYVLRARVLHVRPPSGRTGVVPVVFTVLREFRGTAPPLLTVDFDPSGDKRALSFHRGDVFLISTRPRSPGAASGADEHSIGNACTLRQLVGVRR